MASVNVGEGDFEIVASAANSAADNGDMDEAHALDKLARKINAAISRDSAAAKLARTISGRPAVLRWQDVPSVLIQRR